METKRGGMIFGLLLVFVLSLSLVSASWLSDFFGTPTGETIICDGAKENGTSVCRLECGASEGCDGRSVTSQFACDGNKLYDSSSSTICECPSSCQAIVQEVSEPEPEPTPQNTTSTNTSTGNTTSQTCTDSDGGKNFNQRGTTTKGTLSVTDYCGGGDGKTLYEHYCDSNGNVYQNFNYLCPNGCSDGACVNSSSTTTSSSGGGGGGSSSSPTTTTTPTTSSSSSTSGSSGGGGGGAGNVLITKKEIKEEGKTIEIEKKVESSSAGETKITIIHKVTEADGSTSERRVVIERTEGVEKEIRVEGKEGLKVKTELEIDDNFEGDETELKTVLSNGRNAEIKVMPDTASETAIKRLKLKVCSEENNCIIELKEVGKEEETKLAYELKAEKSTKILGLFEAQMQVEAQVDAENGEVITTEKPWWAFIATESSEIEGEVQSEEVENNLTTEENVVDIYYANVGKDSSDRIIVTFGVNTDSLMDYGIQLNFDHSKYNVSFTHLKSEMLCADNDLNGKVGCAGWPPVNGGDATIFTLTQISQTGSSAGSMFIEEVNGVQVFKTINLLFQ